LTVAEVPTGMNAGVSKLPCSVVTTPVRAAVSGQRPVIRNPMGKRFLRGG
jgi:hypothetical protein